MVSGLSGTDAQPTSDHSMGDKAGGGVTFDELGGRYILARKLRLPIYTSSKQNYSLMIIFITFHQT